MANRVLWQLNACGCKFVSLLLPTWTRQLEALSFIRAIIVKEKKGKKRRRKIKFL